MLDRLPRNIFRDEVRSLSYDKMTRVTCMAALKHDRNLKMPDPHACFCIVTTMHSLSLAAQDMGIEPFSKILNTTGVANQSLIAKALNFFYAHQCIIARFQRFTHRNTILGRESSAKELAFLEEYGSRL